ncbi:MAG: SIS domain-containing protein [Desulfurococcales archaeon]|nr:SIS domain-containing protein [Desulfurococcales archaeon]
MSSEGFTVMFDYYRSWGRVARRAYQEGLNVEIPSSYYAARKILFCGMGGSGIAGLYAHHILKSTGARIASDFANAHRCGPWVDRTTLVFAISFSGNTTETLQCAADAGQRGAKIVFVSRGGAMEDVARERGYVFLRVPEAPAPRAGLPGLLYSVLGALVSMNILNPIEAGVDDSIDMLSNEAREAVDYAEAYSATLYKARGNPLIVATGFSIAPVALRAKNEFAENAKLPSYIGVFPESGHNDIEAWSRLERKTFLAIRSGEPFEEATIDAAIETVRPTTLVEIKARSSKPLVALMWPTWIIGLVSLILADMMGVDAFNIPSITRFKRALKSRVEHA